MGCGCFSKEAEDRVGITWECEVPWQLITVGSDLSCGIRLFSVQGVQDRFPAQGCTKQGLPVFPCYHMGSVEHGPYLECSAAPSLGLSHHKSKQWLGACVCTCVSVWICVMANFPYQLNSLWVTETLVLGVPVRALLGEISIWMDRFSKVVALSNLVSIIHHHLSSSLNSWLEQNRREGWFSLLCFHWVSWAISSPALGLEFISFTSLALRSLDSNRIIPPALLGAQISDFTSWTSHSP